MLTSLFVVGCLNSMGGYRPVQHASTLWVDALAWIVGGLVLNVLVLSNLRSRAGWASRVFFSLVGLCIVGLLGITWIVGPLLTASCNFDLGLVFALAVAAMLVFAAQALLFQSLGNMRPRGILALVASSAVLVGVMTIAKEELAFPMICPATKTPTFQVDNSPY